MITTDVDQEDAPGASAERLSILVEAIDDGAVGLGVLDLDLRFVTLNRTLARMNGMSVEDHLGRTPMQLLPGLEPSTIDALRSVVETGNDIRGHEFVLETPASAGQPRAWLENYHAIRDKSGAVSAVGIVVVEITGRVATEHRMRQLGAAAAGFAVASSTGEVAERLADRAVVALDGLRAAVWLFEHGRLVRAHETEAAAGTSVELSVIDVDADHVVAAVSRQSVSFFGRRPGAASESPLLAAVPVPVSYGPAGVLLVELAGGRALVDDERRWLESLGQIAGQAITRVHVADRERAAVATIEQLLSEIPVGVVVADEHAVTRANRQAEAIFGREIRAGMPVEDFSALTRFTLDGSPYPVSETPMMRTLTRGAEIRDEEMIILRPDGTRIWVAASSTPLRGAAGRVEAAVLLYADITRRREAEGVRDAYLGVLSHELRTPITSIYGGTHVLLKSTALSPSHRAVLEDTAAEAERLLRLVENLLVVARAERGAIVEAADPVLVQRLLPAIVEEMRRRWPGTEFAAIVRPNVPVALGDEAYVGQIVRNLMSNAAKYGAGSDVDVEVAADLDRRRVTVAVRDRGPGIGPEDLPSVFDLFYRARTTASAAPGAGIGLFVAQQLARAMGGTVACANREGGGCEFILSLPVLVEEP